MLTEISVAVESIAPKTSYIDLECLQQCLQMYYSGSLDDVPDLSRLWMRCDRLIPGNPLAGLLDSVTMKACLVTIPLHYEAAIALIHCTQISEDAREKCHAALRSVFVRQANWLDFDSFKQWVYCEGLLLLAEEVRGNV